MVNCMVQLPCTKADLLEQFTALRKATYSNALFNRTTQGNMFNNDRIAQGGIFKRALQLHCTRQQAKGASFMVKMHNLRDQFAIQVHKARFPAINCTT